LDYQTGNSDKEGDATKKLLLKKLLQLLKPAEAAETAEVEATETKLKNK
jgi:hypothetical protein